VGGHLRRRFATPAATLLRMGSTVVRARAWRGLAALVATASLGVPGAAQAQEPGVHVDPDSPSGREYVIPLEEARRVGRDTADQPVPTSGSAQAPLFGDGIEPAAAAAPKTGGSGDASSKRKPAAGSSRAERAAGKDGGGGPPATAAVYAGQGTSGRPQIVFLGGALALVLASFGAYRLAARRRARG
jgi:hypothetical protein